MELPERPTTTLALSLEGISEQSKNRPDASQPGASSCLESRYSSTATERVPPDVASNQDIRSVGGPQSPSDLADFPTTAGPVLGSPNFATVENVREVTIAGGLFLNTSQAVVHYVGIPNEHHAIKGKEVVRGNGNPIAGPSSDDAAKIDTDSCFAKSKGKANDNSQGTPRKDYDIYYDHLLLAGRGSPMWRPGPNMRLSKEYRKNGIGFGDVGIIYRSEGFSFLFNIFLGASHPINKGRVPYDFEPFDFGKVEEDLEKTIVYGRGHHLASSSLRKVSGVDSSGIIFETFASEGAILIMPDGGTAEDLLNHNLLRKYIAKHAKSWYNYIREVRGREVKNGDIRLVIGFDKVSSWGIATFAKNVEERVRLEFRTIDSDQPASRTYVWNCVGGGSGRVGPQEEEMDELAMSNSASETSIKNQTIFVRTLNFNLKGKTWNDLTCHKIRSSDHSSSNSGSRSNQRPSGPSGGWSSSGSEESHSDQGSVNFEATQFGLSVVHPSNQINDLLLKKFPEVQIVITDDLDWITVLIKEDVIFPSPEDLCERLLSTCEIREEDGILTFSKKKQDNKEPSQPNPLRRTFVGPSLRWASVSASSLQNLKVRHSLDEPKTGKISPACPAPQQTFTTSASDAGNSNWYPSQSHWSSSSNIPSGSYGVTVNPTSPTSWSPSLPMNPAPASSPIDDRPKHTNQQSAGSLPTSATPMQLQHHPQPSQLSEYATQLYPTHQLPPSTTTIFQSQPLPPTTSTPQPRYGSSGEIFAVRSSQATSAGPPVIDPDEMRYRPHLSQPPPPHQMQSRVAQQKSYHPYKQEHVAPSAQMNRRRSQYNPPTTVSSVGSNRCGAASASGLSSLMSNPGPLPLSRSALLSGGGPPLPYYEAPSPFAPYQPPPAPRQLYPPPLTHYQPPPTPHYPPWTEHEHEHEHTQPPLSSHGHPSQQHAQPPTHTKSSLSSYACIPSSPLIGPRGPPTLQRHQSSSAPPPPLATMASGSSGERLNSLDWAKLMQSYDSILNPTPRNVSSSSFPGGQSGGGDISPETMAAMQLNAAYGRQSPNTALKQLGGGSPAAPGPLPSPVSAPPTISSVGQQHDVQSSISAFVTSSSLASAVSVTTKEAAVTPAPSSSSSKTNKSPKTSRDIVIEGGPMKKGGKGGGGKSGDRKQQAVFLL